MSLTSLCLKSVLPLVATLSVLGFALAPSAEAAGPARREFTVRVKVNSPADTFTPADTIIIVIRLPTGGSEYNCYDITPNEWTDVKVSGLVGREFAVWASQSCYNSLDLASLVVRSDTTLFEAELTPNPAVFQR